MKKAGMSRSQRKLARMAAGVTADYLYPGSGKYVRALVGKSKPKKNKRRQGKNRATGGYTRQSEKIPAAEGDVIHHSPKRHTFVVEEEELLTSISGNTSSTPSVSVFRINPRNAVTFPWMSSIALAFEMYKFTDLEFRFDPTCGTSENGTVTMGIEYQPSDVALTTEAQVMAIPGSASGPVYRKITCKGVAGGRSMFAKDLFLDQNAAADIDTRDLGNFYLMVTGTTLTSVQSIGRLFVRYKVHLSVQQIATSGALKGRGWYGSWVDGFTSDVLVYGGVSGTAPVVSTNSELFIGSAGVNGIKFLLPGAYMLITYVETTNSAATAGANVQATFAELPVGSISYTQFGTDIVMHQAVALSNGAGYIVRMLTVKVPNATLQLEILTTNVTDVDFCGLAVIPVISSSLLTQPEDSFEVALKLYEERQRLRRCRVSKTVKSLKAVEEICEEEKSCLGDSDQPVFEKKKRVDKSPLVNTARVIDIDRNVKRTKVVLKDDDGAL